MIRKTQNKINNLSFNYNNDYQYLLFFKNTNTNSKFFGKKKKGNHHNTFHLGVLSEVVKSKTILQYKKTWELLAKWKVQYCKWLWTLWTLIRKGYLTEEGVSAVHRRLLGIRRLKTRVFQYCTFDTVLLLTHTNDLGKPFIIKCYLLS